MPRAFQRAAMPALVLVLAAGAAAAQQQPAASSDANQPTVVIVVRHAEKQAEGSDPGLTEAGARRALALVGVARDAGVRAIYTSQFVRTRNTAQPLADSLKIPVTVHPITSAGVAGYPQSLASEILGSHRGHTVLVVSHSNTVPQIVQALSGKTVPEITDPEYDHLFVVVIPPAGEARVVRAMFGLPGASGQPSSPAMLHRH